MDRSKVVFIILQILWVALLTSLHLGGEHATQRSDKAEEDARRAARNITSSGKVYDAAERLRLQQKAERMFYHGYDNYMAHAFPHDDLRPLSKSYTDSLGELGTDGTSAIGEDYQGVAMTLIDSMSTLAVMGNASEFERQVHWLVHHVSFDVDVQVNVFEVNIRLLGGLLSAHLLASDPNLGHKLMPGGYEGGLLDLAYSLALRLLPAFLESPTGLPYAWINLRHGMNHSRQITGNNVAACGSLLLEMGTLSRLTGNPVFEDAATRALEELWGMRSPLDLFGSELDVEGQHWKDGSGGIGPSSDSFYEYLLKAYILLGEDALWDIFQKAYKGAIQHYRLGAWYQDAHITTGLPTHVQFSALQAFWPGMQVLAGDVIQAVETFENFMSVWRKYGALPERYLFLQDRLHPTEQYYPLRPELFESNTYLYQATNDERYLAYGEAFMADLYNNSWVEGGWASLHSVASLEKEDHMHSFFLAEACKYLFLLYNDTFLREGNYVFTTEGHPLPVTAVLQRKRTPPHQHRPPGNQTVATLHGHPFYRSRSGEAFESASDLSWMHDMVLQRRLDKRASAEGSCSCANSQSDEMEGLSSQDLGGSSHVSNGSASWPAWGFGMAARPALEARVCPWYGKVPVTSLCHVPDRFGDHHCQTNEDCGIDAGNCRERICTSHGFCGTVLKNVQWIPNLESILKSHMRSTGEIRVEIETVP